jgi:hypothetical protein
MACQQPDRKKPHLVLLRQSLVYAFCGAGVDGEGHPVIGVTCIGEAREPVD